MKCFVKTDENGKILSSGMVPASMIGLQVGAVEVSYEDAMRIKNNELTHCIEGNLLHILTPPTLTEAKADKLQELSEARYLAETGGIEVNNLTIATDRESQAMLTGAYVSLKQGLVQTVNWKGDNGWSAVTLTEIEPIAQAVGQHVQACFTKESQLAAQVTAAATVEEVAAIAW